MEVTALLLSRLQFAFTISFHIIFPAFTIGLAAWLTVVTGIAVPAAAAAQVRGLIVLLWAAAAALAATQIVRRRANRGASSPLPRQH